MNKFFAKKIKDDDVYFYENDIEHITKVLRLKVNSKIIVNFQAKKYLCWIINLNPLRAKIIEELSIDVNNDFILNVYLSSIKPNHMELAIIKATELNVDNFYIFKSQYSQNNIIHNLNRYEKLMISACKQANRNKLMKIEIINDYEQLNQSLNQNDLNLIAHFETSTFNPNNLTSLKNPKIGLIIGPEGGFSDYDFNQMHIKNKDIINLTKTILRSETALIYLISVVSYLLLNH